MTHNTVSNTWSMFSKCKWNSVELNIKESLISSLGEHSCRSVHVGSGPAKTFIPSPTQLQIFLDFLDHA